MSEYKFNISYEKDYIKNKLPCTIDISKAIKFTWDLPGDFKQSSYVFEMRTVYPVKYSDGITYDCAYLSSGIVNSEIQQHNISTINGVVIDPKVWLGSCEIRLRVYDKKDGDGNQLCTHKDSSGVTYTFEGEKPQGKLWDSRNDSYYFCFDISEQTFNIKQKKIKFNIKQSSDVQHTNELQYVLQLSKSPLFGKGLYSNHCIEKIANPDLNNSDLSFNIPAVVLSNNSSYHPSDDEIQLQPNVLYFYRLRSFDGYDYSDWTYVKTVKVIFNSIPVPKILGVYYPKGFVTFTDDVSIKDGMITEDGMVAANYTFWKDMFKKNNNEVTDELITGISFSQNVRPNGQMIIKLCVDDTNHDYVIGGLTYSMYIVGKNAANLGVTPNDKMTALDKDNEEDSLKFLKLSADSSFLKIPTNKQIEIVWNSIDKIRNNNKYVFLYFEVSDGVSSGYVTSNQLYIHNYSNDGGDGGLKVNMWVGLQYGRNNAYTVLPDSILRYALSSKDEYISETSSSSSSGCGGHGINYASKYQVGTSSSSWFDYEVSQPGSEDITLEDTIIVYDKFYKTQNVVSDGKMVSYCLYCDEAVELRSYYLYNNKIYKPMKKNDSSSSSDLYDYQENMQSFENAFQNNLYDGSHYQLIFICPKCHRKFDMSLRYQTNLNYEIKSIIQKPVYSYYYGYNSDVNYLNDNGLSHDLILSQKSEYNVLVKEWEDKYGYGSTHPYTYELISQWYKDNNDNKDDRYCFMPEHALLNLKNRPEFEPYFTINMPRTLKYNYAQYVDGARLNETIEDDYMYGYKPQQAYTDTYGEYHPADPGDPDLFKLANQFPWNLRKRIAPHYIFGKTEKDYKKDSGYTIANSENDKNFSSTQFDSSSMEIVSVCFDAEKPNVTHQYNKKTNTTIIYDRIEKKLKFQFPLIFTKNNNKAMFILNDKQKIDCELPLNNEESIYFEFPFSLDNFGNPVINQELLKKFVDDCLTPLFGELFSVEDVLQYKKDSFSINFDNKTVQFSVYSKTSPLINCIKMIGCENSCYNMFGIAPFISYQNYQCFPGDIGYIRGGFLNRGRYDNFDIDNNHEYYYTTENYQLKTYDCEESPIDNTIQDKFGVLNTNVNGQPLFTCYKDQVNKDGYHFMFTEQDFKKTGKIYIRTYHIQMCNPCPREGFGYRDWMVFPIEGKTGRYYKKKVLNMRGDIGDKRLIKVLVDGEIIQEYGYFVPTNDGGEECVSHTESNSSSSSSENNNEKVYEREELQDWRNKLLSKTCVVFDYVDITYAFTKNIIDMQQRINPFNHKHPINLRVGINDFINRYGVYVMGAYDLTSEQKVLQNDGVSYEKTFSSSVVIMGSDSSVTSSWVEYVDVMPNNWRPQLINSIFTVDESQSKEVDILVGEEVKTINSYDRYKKTWKNKILQEQNSQLSQFTVEQFNPSFNNYFAIYEKWGYQPQKRVEDYWTVIDLYHQEGRYIANQGVFVYDVYNDPFADERIVSRISKQQKFVSDKNQTEQQVLKLPLIDYLLNGRIAGDNYKYFSGYPRSEHEAYQTRPQPVYGYDRQWRIGGLNRTTRNENNKYNDAYGAYIDKMIDLVNYGFCYLQENWNSYNRIHWNIPTNTQSKIYLYAQQFENSTSNTTIGDKFSLKTSSSLKDQNGKWYVPFNTQMSDTIDILNSGLEWQKHYKLSMIVVSGNTQSGEVISNKTIHVSKNYPSPATIVSMNYNPWTHELTVQFRIDDLLGRRHDIVGAYYSADQINKIGDRINKWENIDLKLFKGQILDLKPNLYGDNVSNKNLIITHKISINIDDLIIKKADSFRIQLITSFSSDRQGLTLPEFSVKMWSNEFLKPIQERIRFLQGYTTRWVEQEKAVFNSDGTVTVEKEWKFLNKQDAVMVQGSIQNTSNKIKQIEQQINANWCNIASFMHFDYDALVNYLHNTQKWESFYYVTVFNDFMEKNKSQLLDKYNSFREENESKIKFVIINKLFLKNNYLDNELNQYFEKNKYTLLQQKKETEDYSIWFKSHESPSYANVRSKYYQNHKKEYEEYYGLSSSSSGSSDSSSSSIPDDELIVKFILETRRSEDFIRFYSNEKKYADTSFQERALIMFKQYGVETDGLWWNTNSPSSSANQKYQNWDKENGHKYDNISDKYMMFLISEEKYVSNIGKSLYRSSFLSTKTSTGQTYSQKYQSLNKTLNDLILQLNENKKRKIEIDTDFRSNLIKQGYFCNGFENNMPYKNDRNINTCFRWRVETRPYFGTIDENTSYDKDGESVYGYQKRFDAYLRFQMDFYDEFNSQGNNQPLRDIIFLPNVDGIEERIKMGIGNSDGNVITSPDEEKRQPNKLQVPDNGYSTYSAPDIGNLQLSTEFNLPITYLPGQFESDFCPEQFVGGWQTKNLTYPNNDDYKNAYYWRVAPYNIVQRPIFELMINELRIDKANSTISFDNTYHSDCIKSTKYNGIYYAFDTRDKQVWKKSIESALYYNEDPYLLIGEFQLTHTIYDIKNNKWIDIDRIKRGQVQFVTDRPRKMYFGEESSSETQQGYADKYNIIIPNVSGEKTYEKLEKTYTVVQIGENKQFIPIYKESSSEKYLFCAVINGMKRWVIGNSLKRIPQSPQKLIEIQDKSSFTITADTDGSIVNSSVYVQKRNLYYGVMYDDSNQLDFYSNSSVDYPQFASNELWFSKETNAFSNKVIILWGGFIESSSSSSEGNFSNANVQYIWDEMNNYAANWYPFTPIRKKPFVLRLDHEYLLFSHKLKSNIYKGDNKLQQNVITLSRGFANNIFGQESVCFPKYNYQNFNEIDKMFNDAFSFKNACVIKMKDNNAYRMYFNVDFYINKEIITKVYKADTYDFDNWFDYKEIHFTMSGKSIVNCLQPFVNIKTINSSSSSEVEEQYLYQMYVSRKNEINSCIEQYESEDGINYYYKETVIDDRYGYYDYCSPCLYEDQNVKKLYFTILSAPDANSKRAGLIVSYTYPDKNSSSSSSYVDLTIEKGAEGLSGTQFQGGFCVGSSSLQGGTDVEISYYFNPCVIKDYDGGFPVQRMFYNTYDVPYLWYNENLTKANGLLQLTIHSDYLQKYEWSKHPDYDSPFDIEQDDDWENINSPSFYETTYETGKTVEFKIKEKYKEYLNYGIKLNIVPAQTIAINLSQGDWIDSKNIVNTQAILNPQKEYLNYNDGNYTPQRFIYQNQLESEYYKWLENSENANKDVYQFIWQNKYMSQYNWWKRQGYGVYKYIGYDVIKNYEWKSKGNKKGGEE